MSVYEEGQAWLCEECGEACDLGPMGALCDECEAERADLFDEEEVEP